MNKRSYEASVKGIHWSELPGAYGTSFEMGSHLLAAASRDEEEARDAIGMILGHVCHQGVLAPSAVPAARLLFQLAALEEPVHRWLALQAVEMLLECSWTLRRYFGFVPRRRMFAGALPPPSLEDIRETREYDQLSEQIQVVQRLNAPLLRKLLGDEDARTRAHAARTLGLVGMRDEASLDALVTAHAGEEDDAVRAGMFLSSVLLARNMEATERETFSRRDPAANSLLEGIIRTVASLLLAPEPSLEPGSDAVREGLRARRLDVDIFPWCDGSPAGLVAEALVLVSAGDELISPVMLEALRYWREQPEADEGDFQEWSELELIGERAVEHVFGEEFGCREFLSRAELSLAQHSFLFQLKAFLPQIPGAHGLQASGIRSPRRDMTRLLGEVSSGLDHEMCWSWERRRVNWPLWKWWHQAALADGWREGSCFVAREYVLEVMQRQLPPERLFSAAVDVVDGAYDIPHVLWVRMVGRSASFLKTELEAYSLRVGEKANGKQAALVVLPSLMLAQSEPVSWLAGLWNLLARIEPAELKEEAEGLARSIRR